MLIRKNKISISLCCIMLYAVSLFISPGYAGTLQVQNFNALYRTAANRRLDIISNAISRGMNIDSIDSNGDTGLCVAIRNNDYTAYQVFRHFGANPNHGCILRIPQQQYSYFMSAIPTENEYTSASARYANRPISNYARGQQYANLYHSKWLSSPWVWAAGGAAVIAGGIALASHGGGGKSKGKYNPAITPTPTPSPDPDPGPGPDPQPDPQTTDEISQVVGYDLSTLHGVYDGDRPFYNKDPIYQNIEDSADAEISTLWALYNSNNTNIINNALIDITTYGSSYNKEHWGGIYSKNGYTFNAGVIKITSDNKYAAGIMACVVDSYTINTACFTNDENLISGDIYNKGTIDISANQSQGIYAGKIQRITNAGTITMNGNDNTGIFVYGSADSIQNEGTITLQGEGSDFLAGSMSGIWVSDTADITNSGNIEITNENYTANGIYNKEGTITNTGTVSIYGSGIGLKTNEGNLINKGVIDIINSNGNETYGMKIDKEGTVSNSGNIEITGSGYGIYITAGTVTNETEGNINLTRRSGRNSTGYAMAGYGTLTNNGTISSAAGGMTGDNLINNGTIESDDIALYAKENTFTGTKGYAENNGTITTQNFGFYTQKNGSFKNTGTTESALGIRTDLGAVTNSGTINSNSTGINTITGAINNSGTISSMGTAIETAQSTITNEENAVISSDESVGILAHTFCLLGDDRCEDADESEEEEEGGNSPKPKYYSAKLTINNDGKILMKNGGTAIQILGDTENAKSPTLNLTNNGSIIINNRYSHGTITGIDGLGYDSTFSDEDKAQITSTSTITNNGDITIDTRGTNIDNAINGIVIGKGTINNNGILRIYKDIAEETTDHNVVGIKIEEGTATNSGTIYIYSNNAIGMLAEYKGDPEKLKEDEIKVQVINEGEIELIGKNNIALYAKNKGSAVTNKGTVTIREANNTDIYRRYTDTVYTETNSCNEFICLEDDAVYKNEGVILSETSLHFNSLGGNTLLGIGSKITAPAIVGTLYADYDLVTNNFDNVTITEDDSLVGDTSELQIKSLSALYTAQLVPTSTPETITSDLTNSNAATAIILSSLSSSAATNMTSHAISLTRKSFHEFTSNPSVGEYLENNYVLGNNMQFYNDLKQSSRNNTLTRKIDQSLGLKLFPSFSKQVIDNLRNINTDITNSLIANDNNQEIRSIVSLNSHYRTQDKTSELYGFEDRLQSVFGVIDKLYNNDLRLGLGVNYARSDTKFDENNKRKNNVLQIFAPFMYNNSTYKFISTPHIGYIWGNYQRHTEDKTYKGNTQAFYYGLTNELSRDIALENFILEPTTELNLAGLYSNKIKDSQGLNVDSHNDISAEIGIGLYLKKRFEFANKRNLSVRIGGSTYYEMLHPYKKLHGSLPGMLGSYNFSKPSKSKNHSVLKASVKYQQDHINLIGELNKYIEDTDGYEFNLNMQYDLQAQ